MIKGISVIIATYNRQQFIGETIQSVLDQQFENLEIIIVDDGSTDNTLPLAKSFGSKVRIVEKPANCNHQGVASTRNRGLHCSTQPFVCFLDSDDLYLPNHLSRLITAFENENDLGFVFCRSLELKNVNGLNLARPWTRGKLFRNDIKNPVVSRSQIVNTNSFMFRKEVFETVGYFDETYTNGEDGDLWMRISERFRGRFIDNFGSAYRTNHSVNQLNKQHAEQIIFCLRRIFQAAKDRYDNLKLSDSKRIFKIKYNLLRLNYRNNNDQQYVYFYKYFGLICRYPAAYVHVLIEKLYDMRERKERRTWKMLENYFS